MGKQGLRTAIAALILALAFVGVSADTAEANGGKDGGSQVQSSNTTWEE